MRLTLFIAVVALAGCLDLDASPPDCFPEDGCGAGQACVSGTCVAVDEPALLLAAACLGAPNGACDESLTGAIGAQADNACLVASVGGEPRAFPFRWRGELKPAGAPPRVPRTVDVEVSGSVFFLADGAASRCTADLTPGAACAADFCVARLDARPVLMPSSGDITLDFLANGRCAITWAGAGPIDDCDRKDQDCDAVIDEGTPGLGEVCAAGLGVCAREGQVVCEGQGAMCDAVPGEPAAAEQENGEDDDCDGMIDEGVVGCVPGSVTECGAALGVCQPGQRRCGDDGVSTPCLDEAGRPVVLPDELAETCDERDEDCDGATDEGLGLSEEGPFVGEPCAVGVGSCAVEGVVVCGDAGAAVCNAVPGQPRNERCDGFDDDCDGAVDEGFDLGAVCTEGVGACLREGVLECADDAVTCSVVAADPALEACGTGVDEDCDGETDEGFDTIGDDCVEGLGICRVEGSLRCDPDDPTRLACDIAPLPAEPEACNQLDDDCDGGVDEDFDLTSDPENCGVCGRGCALPNAIVGCAQSECTVGDCADGFVDQDGDPDNGCECALDAEDLPDPDFVDVDCDGVDGDAETAVFVSADRGDDLSEGTVGAPVRSLSAAAALLTAERRSIYLTAGVYALNSTWSVPSGVGLYGGYLYDGGESWQRAPRAQAETVLTGPAVVLRYEALDARTRLENLSVTSGDAPAGDSSIAVVVINGGDHLGLVDVALRSGRGGDGVDGQAGAAGRLVATPGEPGAPTNGACRSCGGAGGTNPQCEGADGGAGGGSNLPEAERGAGEGGGEPGGNGPAGDDAEPGGDGGPGGHGATGRRGTVLGGVGGDGRWAPNAGGDGTIGAPGGGGGGGGRGGLEVVDGPAQQGGGGGGGGGGGCPGRPGAGAGGGGASVGLLIYGGQVELQRTQIFSGRGGDGGVGGVGGAGARGASGGNGGAGCETCGDGGPGGEGGPGGCGGHGGSGAGGPSFAILKVGPVDAGAVSVARFVDDEGDPDQPRNLGNSAGGTPGAAPARAGCPEGEAGEAAFSAGLGCCNLDPEGRCATLESCP